METGTIEFPERKGLEESGVFGGSQNQDSSDIWRSTMGTPCLWRLPYHQGELEVCEGRGCESYIAQIRTT